MVDKGGSEGCVFGNSDSQVSSQVLEVQVPAKTLSVSVPSIWPVISSLCLYQDPEASTSPRPGDGGTTDSLHRRYSCPGGVLGASKGSCRGISVPPEMPGFQSKPEKIFVSASPSDGIPGLYHRYSPNEAEAPCGVTGQAKRGVSLRKSPCSTGGKNEYNITSNPTSTILSPPTDGPVSNSQSVLEARADNRVQGGTDVVGHPDDKLEWEVPPQEGSGRSDASLTGWGATSQNQRTGGQWSQTESRMHKNCLELLAATLAVMTFLKNKTRMSVLLRLDNTTAVAYINNLGGTVSKELVDLAKSLWMWCLERNIHIIAQHLPGVPNVIADAESRTIIDRSDWQLNPVIFSTIAHIVGPIEVDMFASRLTAQQGRIQD